MRRLFSMFAGGAPGAGLLVMRAVAGGAVLAQAAIAIATGPSSAALQALEAACAAAAVFLIVGLWTPIAALLIAAGAAWQALHSPADPGYYTLLATLAVALAMLGPGIWSIDARLFGWKRVEIRSRDRSPV